MYRPTIRPIDLWHGVADQVGSLKHCHLIDLIQYGVLGPNDEELLVLYKGGEKGNGHTENEISDILGIPQQAVAFRFERILRRARDGTLPRPRRAGRGSDPKPVQPEVRDHRPVPGAADQAA